MDNPPPILPYAPAERFSPWPNVAYAAMAGFFSGLLAIGSFLLPFFSLFLPGLAFGIIVGSSIPRARHNGHKLVFQFALISMVLHTAMALLLVAMATSGLLAQLAIVAGVSMVQVWLGASIAGARALLYSVLVGTIAGPLCVLPSLFAPNAASNNAAYYFLILFMSIVAWHTTTAAAIGFSQTPGENAFTRNPPFA